MAILRHDRGGRNPREASRQRRQDKLPRWTASTRALMRRKLSRTSPWPQFRSKADAGNGPSVNLRVPDKISLTLRASFYETAGPLKAG